MLSEISSEQFAEWAAYYELEPFGCEVEDQRTALQCATVANSFARSRLTAIDFMPKRIPEKPMSLAKRIVAALGGTVRG